MHPREEEKVASWLTFDPIERKYIDWSGINKQSVARTVEFSQGRWENEAEAALGGVELSRGCRGPDLIV